MRTIRASEIGAYLFCKRAWWFQRQGMPSQNQAELAGGTDYHLRHGQKVMRASLLHTAGWLLFFLAVLILVAALTLYFTG